MMLIIDWLASRSKVPIYIDKLIVFYLPQSGPPTFITPVRDATAPAGGAATFNVYVTGSPMPNVTW